MDARLAAYFNGPGGPDGAMHFVSNSSLYLDAGAPLALIATGIANHDEHMKITGYTMAASLAISTTAEALLKNEFHRERPYLQYPNMIVGKTHPTDYSFPSGHSSSIFSTATSLSLAYPKWYVVAPSFAFAGVVGYSRTYLGAHYPGDVLAGAILGSGTAYLTYKAQKWLFRKR